MKIVEDRLIDAEVFSEDVAGRVGEPVVDVEGGANAIKVAVVEDEEEFVVVVKAGRSDISTTPVQRYVHDVILTLEQYERLLRGNTRCRHSSKWWIGRRRSRQRQRQGFVPRKGNPIQPDKNDSISKGFNNRSVEEA